jgi:hypothetical protein
VHVAVVAALALQAQHNGWLYSTPGAGIGHWTAAWGLGHLWVTAAGSYGLPVLFWPLALAAGGSLPSALPALVVGQVLIGGAILVLATYGIAARIGGRLFGYVSALAWIVAPLLTLGFFYADERTFLGVPFSDYRGFVHDVVLPDALGLTVSASFLSLVSLAVAAWLLVRHLDTGDWNDLLLGGLVAGFAVGIEPTNALFLPAPVVGLAVARRWREVLGFALALLPALGTIALWRWTGFGHVPAPEGVPFTWEELRINSIHLRGAGWSLLLVLWVAVAGAFALVRKAPAKGALVAAWFAAFFVVNSGSLSRGSVLDGSLFRLIEPAYPALVLLAAAVLLLVPTWGRRRPEPRPTRARPRLTWGLAAAVVFLAVYPAALVAFASPAPRDRVVVQEARSESVPVSKTFDLRVERHGGRATLSWQAPPAGATTLSYRVYRSPGYGCAYRDRGAGDCRLRMAGAATVRGTTWTDPKRGRFWYRVAAIGDYRAGRPGGDLLLISPATR